MRRSSTPLVEILACAAALPLLACGAESPEDGDPTAAVQHVSAEPIPSGAAPDHNECSHGAGKGNRKAFFDKKADADGNGTVTDLERHAAFERMAERKFAEADTDGDQALTKAEVGDRRWAFVDRADTDGDGKVAKAELVAAFENGSLRFKHREGRLRRER